MSFEEMVGLVAISCLIIGGSMVSIVLLDRHIKRRWEAEQEFRFENIDVNAPDPWLDRATQALRQEQIARQRQLDGDL